MDDYQPDLKAEKKSSKFRYILAGLLLAFAGGAILAVWGAQQFELFSPKKTVAAAPVAANDDYPKPSFDTLPIGPNTPAPIAAAADPVAARVDNLETRLSQINAQADAASGNANRAEGMLIAFAARRAIDSGSALGYIENQIIDRFGGSQSQAVTTIVKSAQDPITLNILRAELASQGDAWTSATGIGVWGKVQRELSELFILRRDTTLSPAPTRRLERARQYTDVGNIEAAIGEVSNLPGKAQARDWTNKAVRYVAVRKALDSIERSALAQTAAPVNMPQTPTPVAPSAAPVAPPALSPTPTVAGPVAGERP